MPLPEFRPDGWLPEGHHLATWDEIVTRFGGTPDSRRASVLSSLLAWRDAARAKRLMGLIILDGSFISRKDAPGDFDLFFVYDEATEAFLKTDAEARTLTDYQACRATGFQGDVFAIPLLFLCLYRSSHRCSAAWICSTQTVKVYIKGLWR